MNKSQLIDALAARYEGNRKAAAHALDSVLDTITREVARGEKVAITGFGSFEKSVRNARWVRNPQTGERMKSKKKSVPKFTAGQDLKNIVGGVKKLPKLTAANMPKPPTVRSVTDQVRSAVDKATPGKKASAKKASTAKAPAAKAPAKKAPAKKAPAKTTAAKTTTTKSTATKTTTAAKKAPAKKAPAKTAAAKKAPAKTAAAKTTTAAKKAPAKKAPAKKTAAKKA
ncbi:DNA-binding protein [Nocardioides gansuensis]|uniref:DNA-binding protein n=1 Tax=Nocardioides gansuensis TaxID=2138300 RepID=A0A2T8FA98_9ACTN|nr:HU family DNA-binding protein [Nocardioides gansuensis]PVG82615.1 DNA-binding protein [Nocardioides gansuensis]